MGDEDRTREELIEEISVLRRRVAALEFREADFRRADESHRIDRARLLATIESLPFDFFALDGEGRYVLQNSVCRRNWGDVVGRRPEDTAPDGKTRALWTENNRRAFAGQVVEGEAEVVVDGEARSIYNIVAPVMDGERIRGVVGVNIDLTQLKKAREDLEQSEERYRSLVENTLHGFFMADIMSQEIVYTNERTREMFGYGGMRKGVSLWDMIAEEDREVLRERMRARMRGEAVAPRQIVLTMRRADGSTFRAELSASVVTSGGRRMLQGLVRDVTEQESLQQQLQQAEKLNALGLLAGGIAHDFSNLLHAILGYTQLLLKRADAGDPGRASLEEIERLAHQAGELTQRILTFSRRTDSRVRVMDLNEALARIEELIRRTMPKMVEVSFEHTPDPVTVRADPAQVEQILMNLAINARDAMPGGGTLTISTHRTELTGEYCAQHIDARPGVHGVIVVRDTGRGMGAEVLEHIFEPFFTTKDSGQGTGLGLSVVYGIVKSHDGHVTCESEPGRGTTFRIHLPASEPDEHPDGPREARVAPGGSETVLIVDDEEHVRIVGRETLEAAGYRVIEAQNGKEAIEAYGRRVDLVVLDMIMPSMGGERVLAEILRIDPDARVVIACGQAVDWSEERALEAGARAIIRKPYDADRLLLAVRRALDEA